MTGMKSIMKLRRCIMRLRRCMQLLQPVRPIASDDEAEQDASVRETTLVPKGHFTVLARKGEDDKKRFVVDLKYLRNPGLLKLLKKAEEEYGFQQEGALVVPCTPEELKMILEENNNNVIISMP